MAKQETEPYKRQHLCTGSLQH